MYDKTDLLVVARRAKYAQNRKRRKHMRLHEMGWVQRILMEQKLTRRASERAERYKSQIEDLYARVISAAGPYSHLLPVSQTMVGRDYLPSEQLVEIRRAMGVDVWLHERGPEIAESHRIRTEVLHLIEGRIRDAPENLGYHMMLQSRLGSVGYYVSEMAIRHGGFRREIIIGYAEQMFRMLEEKVYGKKES